MKKISVYRPTSIEEAIQILSLHGTDAGVYAGGTDLLIRLKNRLKQAPTYLVDVKKIGNLRYIKETPQGGVQIGAQIDRKSTRLNSSHDQISYAVFCLKKKI